jgi:hypothetical protein
MRSWGARAPIVAQLGTIAMERSNDFSFTASIAWFCTSLLGACALLVLT